jgi:Cu+-exporting ATPase
MKIAVVFDSAGTLLSVYRVAKDIFHGKIVENVVSTNMIIKGHNCALVALKVDNTDIIEKADPDMLLSELIEKENIIMEVVCRGTRCPGERITGAALEDKAAKVSDIQEAIAAVKLKCKDIYYVNIGIIVDVGNRSIPYALATGGKLFPGAREMIGRIIGDGADVYIASGDSKKPLTGLAKELNVPEVNVYDAVSPSGKMDVVLSLKKDHDRVIMVGDGVNDQKALQAADISILSLQQGGMRPAILYDSADIVIENILEVESIVEESLHMIKEQNSKNR